MDIAATVLAGLTVLSVPFLLWFGSKARTKRKQEIADIEGLVEERSRMIKEHSRGLTELHSRLDALDKQDSQPESTASGEATCHRLWLLRRNLAQQTTIERNVDWGRYLPALEAPDLGCLRTTQLHRDRVYWIYYLWPTEAETNLDWRLAAGRIPRAGTEDARRKIALRQMGGEQLQEPALQPL
jgi:hypothetical protein